MQLNPARGRKLVDDGNFVWRQMVYAAQPREGTETCYIPRQQASGIDMVYAAQPREGTETHLCSLLKERKPLGRFMQLNPARGRKRYRS